MSKSKIQWTEETWNPVRGCSRVSKGCESCYAETFAGRFSGPGKPWEGFVKKVGGKSRWTGKVGLVPSALEKPLRRKKPTTWFVNSMSDLFHEALPFEDISAVFGVMAGCPQHTFQVLTKRPERMVKWFRWASSQMGSVAGLPFKGGPVPGSQWEIAPHAWPLPNVWLGVSIEDQATADERIPLLLQVPAAVRFVSAEPLLEAVDIGLESATCDCCPRWESRWVTLPEMVRSEPILAFAGIVESAEPGIYRASSNRHGALCVRAKSGNDLGIRPSEFECLPAPDWIIVGGESGPNARPCNIDWIRSIVRQCQNAGVPVFVKQLGDRPRDMSRCQSCLDPSICWCVDSDIILEDPKGGNPQEWPEDLRVREFPRAMQAQVTP